MPHPQPTRSVLARPADHTGVEMDHCYELGMALAMAQIAELRRQADRWRLASRIPGRTGTRRRDRAPGSPRLPDRHGQTADRAGGSRAAPAAARGRGRGTEEAATLVEHHHEPGVFDAGHCRACASQAGLLDHYRRVQQEEEATLRKARRRASVALWSSGAALLLAAIALLSG